MKFQIKVLYLLKWNNKDDTKGKKKKKTCQRDYLLANIVDLWGTVGDPEGFWVK
jgi:hypothetical protein